MKPSHSEAPVGRVDGAPACALTEPRTHALLDDELGEADAAALHHHLAECPRCRAHVAHLRRFATAVRRQRMRQPAAPAALRARVEAMLARLATDAERADAVEAATQAAVGAYPTATAAAVASRD